MLEKAAAELESLFPSVANCPDRLSTSDDDSSQSSCTSCYDDRDTVARTSLSFADSYLSRKNDMEEIDLAASFPSTCLEIVSNLPGNNRCVDCNDANPEWASISYGVLLCLACSGRHRSFGVSVSKVRSIAMDSWSHSEILAMLEGGNDQLSQFFMRHSLTPFYENLNTSLEGGSSKSCTMKKDDDVTVKRYKMKAAQFYRDNLSKHIQRVKSNGEYKGREASRRIRSKSRNRLEVEKNIRE